MGELQLYGWRPRADETAGARRRKLKELMKHQRCRLRSMARTAGEIGLADAAKTLAEAERLVGAAQEALKGKDETKGDAE